MKVIHGQSGHILLDTSTKRRKRKRRIPWLWMIANVALLVSVAIVCFAAYRSIRIWMSQPREAVPPSPQIVREVVEVDSSLPQLDKLRIQHAKKLNEFAEFVRSDAELARAAYEESLQFATESNLDSSAAENALRDLPLSTPLGSGVQVELLGAYADGPIAWIELKVKNSTGQFVSGLTRADLNIFQSGNRFHRVSVATSVRMGRPPDVVLLLDTSGSTTGEPNAKMKQAAASFVQVAAPKSRIKLWSFADQPNPATRWTSDVNELVNAIQSLTADGGTALYDAIDQALSDLAYLDHASAIVLFTDGADSSKQPMPARLIARAIDQRNPIHVVALQTGEVNEPVLRDLASRTKGTLHVVQNANELSTYFEEVATSLADPIYRIAISDTVDPAQQLQVVVGGLPAVNVNIAR